MRGRGVDRERAAGKTGGLYNSSNSISNSSSNRNHISNHIRNVLIGRGRPARRVACMVATASTVPIIVGIILRIKVEMY